MTLLAAVVVVLAVALWASARVPEYLVALGFFTAALLLRLAPPAVVFSGFTSGALWLIFGGQVMGVGIRHTGLAGRIADVAARRLGARSYGAVIAGAVALGTFVSFFLPSAMGRVALLMPVAAAMADRYGFRQPGDGRTGILLAVAFGTTAPAMAILPANVPNAVLAGAAEGQGVTLGYLEYLVLHFPVLGALKAVAVAAVVLLLFPARLAVEPGNGPPPSPLSGPERLMASLLVAALALWATDTLHHLPPAWVSLAVAVPVLVPGLRLAPKRALQEVNFGSLFFVAGILGLGGVISYTGLGRLLGDAARAALPLAPGAPAARFASLAAMGVALSLLTTGPGLPAVMTPLVGPLATASGLPVRTVVMAEVLGFSTNLLPYQSPPVVVAAQLVDLPSRKATAVSLALFALTVGVLLPLDYLWWQLLGWL